MPLPFTCPSPLHAPPLPSFEKLLRDFAEKCDVEEIPEEERRGTITSHLGSGGRAGSISSVQSRGLGSTVKVGGGGGGRAGSGARGFPISTHP